MAKQLNGGKRFDAFTMDPDDVILVEDRGSVLYDERVTIPISEPLVKSIMTQGVLEPVLVRKNGHQVEAIDGRQRIKAAREANKRLRSQGGVEIRVPVLVKAGVDHELAGVMLASNELRFDDDPMTKAQKAHRFLGLGRSFEEAAIYFGVTEQTVRKWRKLLDCAADVQKAVSAGRITLTDAANRFSKLPRDKQLEALGEVVDKGEAPVAATVRKGGKVPKKHPGVTKPLLKAILGLENVSEVLSPRERALVGWIVGDVTDGEVAEKNPRLLGALKQASKPKPKKAPKNGVKAKGSKKAKKGRRQLSLSA